MNETHETKARLLDVAEALFAQEGLDRVSVRDITQAAGAHLSAIHYHFGSKEDLIAAVFERRIGAVNAARLEALDRAERAAGDGPVPVETIIEALIRPSLDCCANREGAFPKLIGRCLTEPRAEIEALLRQLFDPLLARLDAALMKALPHLSRADIFWRTKFTFGALHHWLLTWDRFVPPWAADVDRESQMRKLIAFATAGFQAPSVS